MAWKLSNIQSNRSKGGAVADKPLRRRPPGRVRTSVFPRLMGWALLAGVVFGGLPVAAQNGGNSGSATMADQIMTPAIDSCESVFPDPGDPVSLDFQQAPIADVIQVIADAGGVNIVLAPDVTGNTSILVNEVPWPQVLETVLDNAKLGRECEESIIRVATKDYLREKKKQGEMRTEIIQLNYADVKEVQTRVSGILNPGATVTIDERTKTLVVTDTAPMLKDIIAVVKNLDTPTPQVQIASKIVRVEREFLQELGIQWGFTTVTLRNPQFPNSILTTGGTGLAAGSGGTLNALAPVPQNFMVDLRTTDPPFFGLGTSLISRDGDVTLDMQLSALERQNRLRIVANPKVTTADNKEARIRQGERIPYISNSANEGPKVQYVDANLELTVTPHITADQKVYLRIEARNDAAGQPNAAGVLPISTNAATTEVLVEDGGTAILGGLHERRVEENRRAVPYLADIPIIGNLFKSTRERDAVNELLIFVTPSIIKATSSNL